jgi:hypothetical protein
MLLPPADLEALFDLIPGARLNVGDDTVLPCNTVATLEIQFGSQRFSISPKDYVGDLAPSEVQGRANSPLCSSNIITSTSNDTWLLGDVFLKNVSPPPSSSIY